jgi:hypothetical protein
MSLSDRIKIIIDVATDGANTSLGKFRTSIREAEGASGKLKAGFSQMGSAIKANAAEFAAAAGAALVAFGATSIRAFQDTALEASKLSDALGISVEDASRLMEVSGDLGVDMGALQGAMQRFNKEVGSGRVDLKQFGTDLVYAKDGSVDAVQSFIEAATAIGAITDPTERAREAQRLFGKSYGEIAELMELDAKDLRKALDEVSDAKVIDAEEEQKAKDMRAAMDSLKDSVEDVQLQFGEMLVEMGPTILAMAESIGKLMEGITYLHKETEEFVRFLARDDSITKVALGVDAFNAAVGKVGPTAATSFGILSKEAGSAVRDVETLEEAWSDLKGEIDDREAFMNVEDAFADMKREGMEAYGAAMDGAEDATAKTREYERAQLGAKEELIEFLAEVLKLPPERSTRILAAFDQGNLDYIEDQLRILTRNRDINLSIIARGGAGYGSVMNNGARGGGARARGGPVEAGVPYLVGENPDGTPNATSELVIPHQSGTVLTAEQTRRALASGSTTTIIQNFPRGATPRDVKYADRRYSRIQGPL